MLEQVCQKCNSQEHLFLAHLSAHLLSLQEQPVSAGSASLGTGDVARSAQSWHQQHEGWVRHRAGIWEPRTPPVLQGWSCRVGTPGATKQSSSSYLQGREPPALSQLCCRYPWGKIRLCVPKALRLLFWNMHPMSLMFGDGRVEKNVPRGHPTLS